MAVMVNVSMGQSIDQFIDILDIYLFSCESGECKPFLDQFIDMLDIFGI